MDLFSPLKGRVALAAMALPIEGPFTELEGSLTGYYYRYRDRWKQKRPYDRPLPYEHVESLSHGYGRRTLGYYGLFASHHQLGAEAQAKAYGDFMDNLGTSADLGAAIVTMGQSMDMITARADQLGRFFRYARQGRAKQAFETLFHPEDASLLAKKKRWKKTKSVSSQILEVNFGWAPAIGDIQDAVEGLSQPILFGAKVTGRGKASSYAYTGSPPPDNSCTLQGELHTVTRCRMGAKVRVTNPNLAMARQMGLTDPISWLFERTAWSFVADWFSNLSQFLGSWDDRLGTEWDDPFTTLYTTQHQKLWWTCKGVAPPPPWQVDSFRVTRTLGIASPALVVPAWKGFSLKRGTNAVSLLLQQLPSTGVKSSGFAAPPFPMRSRRPSPRGGRYDEFDWVK